MINSPLSILFNIHVSTFGKQSSVKDIKNNKIDMTFIKNDMVLIVSPFV